jgi:hypothetical protein
MTQEIGQDAGTVWAYLERNGEVSGTILAKGTKLSQKQVDRALGWLAREGKITLAKKANKEVVALAAGVAVG